MPKHNSVNFEIFRGVMASWPDLFEKASAFATSIGPDRLISISHSEDQQDGVVAVWYWGEERQRAT